MEDYEKRVTEEQSVRKNLYTKISENEQQQLNFFKDPKNKKFVNSKHNPIQDLERLISVPVSQRAKPSNDCSHSQSSRQRFKLRSRGLNDSNDSG